MAILETEVSFIINSLSIAYYEEKGYSVPKYSDTNGKIRVKKIPVTINIEDVYEKNKVKITKVCDECGEIASNVCFNNLMISRKRNKGIDYCKKCSMKNVGGKRRGSVKYENSAEHFCKTNNSEFLLELFSNKNKTTMDKISYGSGEQFIWNCSEYGKLHEHSCSMTGKLKSPYRCSYCNGCLINETNCLASTHPHIAEMLFNVEESKNITYGMSNKMIFKCTCCGEEMLKPLSYVVKKGYIHCKKCSDFTSYPEKFILSLLDFLNIEFKSELPFEWSERKRYDFYIPSLNCIIEAHGNQHYEDQIRGRSLKEERDNDRLKERLAKENGIEHYVAIDCGKSELEYIKNNILSSALFSLLHLNDVDWKHCHVRACESLVKKVSDLWNEGNVTANDISKVIGKSKDSTIRLLKKASSARMCNYSAKKEMSKVALSLIEKKKKPVVQLSLNDEYILEFKSVREASRKINRDHSTILRVISGKQKKAGGFKWIYKEDYISKL